VPKPILKVSVHLHAEENSHNYTEPENAYVKEGFYCVLLADNRVVMYPINNIWRVVVAYRNV
jgi:hypothetical protein